MTMMDDVKRMMEAVAEIPRPPTVYVSDSPLLAGQMFRLDTGDFIMHRSAASRLQQLVAEEESQYFGTIVRFKEISDHEFGDLIAKILEKL